MAFALKKDRVFLYTHDKEKINEHYFFKLISRRALGEPIEYITKSVSFYGLSFFVNKGVLIPRPETELLVDKALDVIDKFKIDYKREPKVAEIGIGSGIVSILLALKRELNIVATDISAIALEIAKKNIKKFGLLNKISLIECNLLDGLDIDIDIVVSNPPYISTKYEIPKPLSYEPKEALFAGVDGMDVIRELIELFFKREIKYLVCEIGYDQKELVEGYLKDRANLEFYKDLSGYWRGFVLSR